MAECPKGSSCQPVLAAGWVPMDGAFHGKSQSINVFDWGDLHGLDTSRVFHDVLIFFGDVVSSHCNFNNHLLNHRKNCEMISAVSPDRGQQKSKVVPDRGKRVVSCFRDT